MADLIIGCRAKPFFSQNELLLEPKEIGYTIIEDRDDEGCF